MKIVQINEIPSKVESTPVDNLINLYSIAQKMEQICIKNNGVGLSAVQVGIPWKFFIYYSEENKKFRYMIDCEYHNITDEKKIAVEGCLSIKTRNNKIRHFKVPRYNSIEIVGKELIAEDSLIIKDFKKIFDSHELENIIFQHEIDHQNNILISSIGEEIFLEVNK